MFFSRDLFEESWWRPLCVVLSRSRTHPRGSAAMPGGLTHRHSGEFFFSLEDMVTWWWLWWAGPTGTTTVPGEGSLVIKRSCRKRSFLGFKSIKKCLNSRWDQISKLQHFVQGSRKRCAEASEASDRALPSSWNPTKSCQRCHGIRIRIWWIKPVLEYY